MIKKIKDRKVQNYILLAGLLIALIIVVVPLLMLGEYDYKSIDDFWYSAHGEKCIAEGYGFFTFIKAMWLDTWESYKYVQGTLLATFITRILEGLISSEYYRVVVYIMLPFIVLPEIFFAYIVLKKHFCIGIVETLNISLIFVILQVLIIPYPVEALYWLCGSSYYTIFWGLGVLAVAIFLDVLWKDKRVPIAEYVLLIFLCIFVSLGNLITAVVVFSIFVLFTFLVFLKKRTNRYYLLGAFLTFSLGFLFDVLAPGNGLRVASDNYISPVGAIIKSFSFALEDISFCIKMPFVWLVGGMIGVIAWSAIDTQKGKYRLPAVVFVFFFLILVAHYVPSAYTLQIAGAGRVRNLERYFTLFFFYGNELYILGYIKRVLAVKGKSVEKESKFPTILVSSLVLGLFTCISLYMMCNRTLTSYSAYLSLRTGQAEHYREQNEERLAILEDENVKVAVIKAFTDEPYLLFNKDAKGIEEIYENYYGKEEVIVIE